MNIRISNQMYKVTERPSVNYQYFAVLRLNILSLSFGTLIGWSSPYLPVLLSNESPLKTGPVTKEEASWISSLLSLSAICGAIIFGYLISRYSTTTVGCLSTISIILHWLFIIFGTNVYALYIGRFISGLSDFNFILLPAYVSQIADDRHRGSLGLLMVFFLNFGTLLAFIAGTFLSYYNMAYLMLSFPIMFLVSFLVYPERPQYLRIPNREIYPDQYLTDVKTDNLENEDANIEMMKNSEKSGNVKFAELLTPTTLKAIIFGITLIAFNLLSGCFLMISYAAAIFEESGSNFSPNVSAIIVGVIQLLGNWISVVLVERCGRKFLYKVSSLGTAVSLFALATYDYLKISEFDVEPYNWIPVVSVSFSIFISSCGIIPLPFIVITELSPSRVRGIIMTISMAMFCIFSFLVVKYFGMLIMLTGMYGAFYALAICCVIAFFFYTIFIPETKGKTTEEIIELLK